jgi:flavin reductase (DIM6/NTAB) family NADH-FMN oxidoreductase RutF
MTANSVASVSPTPPLVLWSASLYAQSLPAFEEGCRQHFGARPDGAIKQIRPDADNKFAEIDYIIPECGAPVLMGTAAHFECEPVAPT